MSYESRFQWKNTRRVHASAVTAHAQKACVVGQPPGEEESREDSLWGVEKGPVSGGIWPGSQAQGGESLHHQAGSYTTEQ